MRFVELAMWERLRKADFVDRTDAIASGWDYEGELKAMLSELSPSQMRLECEQPNEVRRRRGESCARVHTHTHAHTGSPL